MRDPDKTCDLCGLPVDEKPYLLEDRGATLHFCCEGCLGIYRLLNELDEDQAMTSTAAEKGL